MKCKRCKLELTPTGYKAHLAWCDGNTDEMFCKDDDWLIALIPLFLLVVIFILNFK